MREILGPTAAPEVEVCFSQKYSDQVDRINKNWLPIYTKEFPTAKPRFLTDETDPGAATKYGTAAFVASLKGGADAAVADALYRPVQVAPAGWADYVHGLLHGVSPSASIPCFHLTRDTVRHTVVPWQSNPVYACFWLKLVLISLPTRLYRFATGTTTTKNNTNNNNNQNTKANGDPFYTPTELATLQAGFFSDAKVARCRNAYAVVIPSNFAHFWHKKATASDTALFKQYCLRAQGVTAPSALDVMPPVTPTAKSDGGRRPYTILAAAAMHSTAERVAALDPERFEYFSSKWRTFPDGTDNITLGGFEPEDRVSGRDILFIASFHSNAATLSQLHALTWLCESALIGSLTVLLPFFPTGTMERYLQPGRIPAANTLAKMISALPATGKRTRVMIYDVHAPPTQYFFANSAAATLHTACPLAIDKINAMDGAEKIDCVAFPDDGACKRFSAFFRRHLPGVEIVTCNKVRTGGKRVVVISEGEPKGKHVLVMDDLIQTGGTLYECAVSLKKAGAATVSGFIVHAVFPGGSWAPFTKGGDRAVFERFWLSSSNPAVCDQIPSGDVFEVLDLAPRILHDLDNEPSGRAAWS